MELIQVAPWVLFLFVVINTIQLYIVASKTIPMGNTPFVKIFTGFFPWFFTILMGIALSSYGYFRFQYGATTTSGDLPMSSLELGVVKIVVLYYALSVALSIGVLVFLFFSFFRMSKANRTICIFFLVLLLFYLTILSKFFSPDTPNLAPLIIGGILFLFLLEYKQLEPVWYPKLIVFAAVFWLHILLVFYSPVYRWFAV